MTSVRQAEYRGHQIVVRTTYEITVDGRPFDVHLTVDNGGRVHYHGLPTRDFPSVIGLVEKAIAVFPADFTGTPAEHAKDHPNHEAHRPGGGSDMAVTRRNIATDQAARDAFVAGVLALKAEFLGTTTADLGIAGAPQQVSTYDLFTVWHHLAMGRMTPTSQNDRNAAHSGPVFAPWHRLMLLLFELQLQRVLGDTTVRLPYWDWATDGGLPPAGQQAAPLWLPIGIGGTGEPVSTGPFVPDASGSRSNPTRSGNCRPPTAA